MKKNILTASLIINFFFLVIFLINFNKFIYSSSLVIANKNLSDEMKIPYQKYQEFFNYITENINVKDLKVKADTTGNNITAIDKEITFNNRESLTVRGDLNMYNTQPTEEFLILENINKDTQITISLMYTDTLMENDLLTFIGNSDFENLNKNLSNKYGATISTYKNLAFTIIAVSEKKIDGDLLIEVNKEIIHLVNSFKI